MAAFSQMIALPVLAGLLALGIIYFLHGCLPRLKTRPRESLHHLAWTLGPVAIFAAIAIPSVRLVALRDRMPETDLTIQITGKMWSWTYEYPEQANLRFTAAMLANPPPGSEGRLLEPEHIVLPVGKSVRVVAVGTNLLYSWKIPALGAEVTGIPGRTAQTWFRPQKLGRFYGECLELCAVPHTFAPIEVEVVSEDAFAAWVAEAQRRYAARRPAARFAAAAP